ncbi:hypothetical protein ATY41_08100 [Leifsonia xyli subsp. xyli]|uniref:RCC1-like domain-containing protein n=2 Tax=Leifsonia xyli TaxID=1575 RepID=A0A1E2SM60_LEIXY|nr:hypothetical protein ATY41_08100 [Leifsonia xyli subsp. xyli]
MSPVAVSWAATTHNTGDTWNISTFCTTPTPLPATGTTHGGTCVALNLTRTITAIAAGGYHSLALASDGTVWAWGHNNDGELGNGTTTASTTPVQAQGLGGRTITAIAAGGYHSLALASDGTVWAWGHNNDGELGNGTTTASTTPVQAQGLGGRTITAIAAGGYHSLALASDGTVWAWGHNNDGELGNGTTTASTTPVQAQGLGGRTITAIAAGGYHSLALASDGTVWAWGHNNDGELGNGTTTASTTPVQAQGLGGRTITAIAAGGYHSLALASDGTVWAWGHNNDGELGNGTTTASTTPVQAQGLGGRTITAIAAGGYHSLALASDGTVWAWGHNNDGELGNGTTTASTTPVQAQGLGGRTITAIAAGGYHSLALASDGTVWAWGHNNDGELGNGTTTASTTPVQVQGSNTDMFDVPVINPGVALGLITLGLGAAVTMLVIHRRRTAGAGHRHPLPRTERTRTR